MGPLAPGEGYVMALNICTGLPPHAAVEFGRSYIGRTSSLESSDPTQTTVNQELHPSAASEGCDCVQQSVEYFYYVACC